MNKYIIKINVLLRYNSHLSPSPNRMERAVGAGADRIKNTCTFSPCWSLPAARRAPPLTQSRTTSQRVTDRSNRPGISESGIRLGRTLSGGRIYFGRPKVPLAVTVKQQKIMIQNSNYGSYIIIRDGQLFLEWLSHALPRLLIFCTSTIS